MLADGNESLPCASMGFQEPAHFADWRNTHNEMKGASIENVIRKEEEINVIETNYC